MNTGSDKKTPGVFFDCEQRPPAVEAGMADTKKLRYHFDNDSEVFY